MPFCSSCGAEHAASANFCANCGTPVAAGEASTAAFTPMPGAPAAAAFTPMPAEAPAAFTPMPGASFIPVPRPPATPVPTMPVTPPAPLPFERVPASAGSIPPPAQPEALTVEQAAVRLQIAKSRLEEWIRKAHAEHGGEVRQKHYPVLTVYELGGELRVSFAQASRPPEASLPVQAAASSLSSLGVAGSVPAQPGYCSYPGCVQPATHIVALRGEAQGEYCQAHAMRRSHELHQESGGLNATIMARGH
jgi:hypothetical protein